MLPTLLRVCPSLFCLPNAQEPDAADKKGAFSLHNIKLFFTDELWTQKIFQNLGFAPTLEPYKHACARRPDTRKIAV